MASVFSISLTEQPVRWLKTTALIYGSSALVAAALFAAAAGISALLAPREATPIGIAPPSASPASMPAGPAKFPLPPEPGINRNEAVAQGPLSIPAVIATPSVASIHLDTVGTVRQSEIAGAKVYADVNNKILIAKVVGVSAGEKGKKIVLRSSTSELAVYPRELNWKRSADGSISATLPPGVTAARDLMAPATEGVKPRTE